jgi:pyranose oxidase
MEDKYDVFIAGAGIIACTFARLFVEQGLRVVMVDAGAQHSRRLGENLKNFANYQGDVDQFGGIVRGLMHPVSIPPVANQAAYTRNALNPKQNPETNLPGAVVAYSVGGMAIHWTCAIPRHHETERISQDILTWQELDSLYTQAEALLNRHTDVHSNSLRHAELEKVLAKYGVKSTPLAAQRHADAQNSYVQYTGADTVLGNLAEPGQQGTLTVLPEHRVSKLLHQGGKVNSAEVRDLRSKSTRTIYADAFVVAAGWVHSAQILWNSDIQRESDGNRSALGRYLSDHTFTACQVVLKKEIVAAIGERSASPRNVGELPIPMDDPAPHLYIPVSHERPWHGQVFREAFQFDPLIQTVDSRLIIDLKWFGMVTPVASNRVIFENAIFDRFGMPQPTFMFTLGEDDKHRRDLMLKHMLEVAADLGDILPNKEGKADPVIVPMGASTHTMGATRMGARNDGTSVADPNSRVWGFNNLYVGGNCLIPTANASNPTLTSVALAIKAATACLSGRNASSVPAH